MLGFGRFNGGPMVHFNAAKPISRSLGEGCDARYVLALDTTTEVEMEVLIEFYHRNENLSGKNPELFFGDNGG
jgi:hypothetical protein